MPSLSSNLKFKRIFGEIAAEVERKILYQLGGRKKEEEERRISRPWICP